MTKYFTCMCPYFQQADPKGLIPKFLVNSKVVYALGNLSDMRKKFDKSIGVDQARRAELVPKIEQLPVGEGAGDFEAQFDEQFNELFTERKGSEEIKLALSSAKSRIKVGKVRAQRERSNNVRVRSSEEQSGDATQAALKCDSFCSSQSLL